MKIDITKNTIVCGDNLEWLDNIPNSCVDLCYIDPPFYSGKERDIVWKNGTERRSYQDKFDGDIEYYAMEWMKPRLEKIKRTLKDSGVLVLHCDWHACHVLRVVLDQVFGRNNFRNEIIWHYSGWNKKLANKFECRHDNLLVYAKSDKKKIQYFNGFTVPWESIEQYVRVRKQKLHTDEEGKQYVLSDAGNGGRIRRYIEEALEYGRPIDDVWNIPNPHLISSVWEIDKLNNSAKEYEYPTQKPVELIERVILSFCPENGLVLDCFAGGGTTALACTNQGINFIIGDVSPVAIRATVNRLHRNDINDFETQNIAKTKKQIKNMTTEEYEKYVCDAMGWDIVHEGNVDARMLDGHPVQLKNWKKPIGRDQVEKMAGTLLKENRKEGTIIGWEFTNDARKEAGIYSLRNGYKINLKKYDDTDMLGNLILSEQDNSHYEDIYNEIFNDDLEQSA